MGARIPDGPNPARRRFIKHGGCFALAGLTPRMALGRIAAKRGSEKTLAFYNTHTGESLKAVYWCQGEYCRETLAEFDFILRDFRADEIKPIAPQLLDLVYELNQLLNSDAPIHVISAYRSPATNAMLAARSNGVATHSLHLVGKAIDLRVPSRGLQDVRRAALALQGGGVGYYPRSDFVHVDIGRVRHW